LIFKNELQHKDEPPEKRYGSDIVIRTGRTGSFLSIRTFSLYN